MSFNVSGGRRLISSQRWTSFLEIGGRRFDVDLDARVRLTPFLGLVSGDGSLGAKAHVAHPRGSDTVTGKGVADGLCPPVGRPKRATQVPVVSDVTLDADLDELRIGGEKLRCCLEDVERLR